MVFCPGCFSNVVKKNGYDRKKTQKYKCLRCRKNFTEKTDTQLSGMRYPEMLITYALTLHFRYDMTYREAADVLRRKGAKISYVTVYNWAKKFGGVFERMDGRFRPYTRIWHITSDSVSINGKEYNFYSVRDSNRNVLSIFVSRGQVENDRLLKDAHKLTGFKPETIMSGRVDSSSPAKMDVKI